jgi:hypothetical protein
VLVSASAIGFYGFDRGDDLLSENSGCGHGFLADVVANWRPPVHRPPMRAYA